jgi:hypothetical protein
MREREENVMIRLVEWDEVINGKDVAEWFIELGHLNETDAEIIRGRRDGKFQYEVASDANVSLDTVKYRGNKLMEKYKRLSKSYPDILKLKKEYESVSAAVSLIAKDGNVYSIAFDNENFDSFENIYEEVVKRIERKYKIKVNDIRSIQNLYRRVICKKQKRGLNPLFLFYKSCSSNSGIIPELSNITLIGLPISSKFIFSGRFLGIKYLFSSAATIVTLSYLLISILLSPPIYDFICTFVNVLNLLVIQVLAVLSFT